ncbi:hypothetical protein ACPPVW_01695 [Leifsonia sp. McL0607]|uniref:hypothetical protein n=1 Tax=Leifsonia sp. McL0607 TaxID=3415672 RepID=UPI003CF9B061
MLLALSRDGSSPVREVLASAHRRQRSGEADLLTAILGLELGTVPRALILAGVDRPTFAAAVRDLG